MTTEYVTRMEGDVMIRYYLDDNGSEYGDADGFCTTCNRWEILCKFYEEDRHRQPCKGCYVDEEWEAGFEDDESRDDYDDQGILCHYSKTTGGWDAIENDDSKYMNEPMPCIVCKCTDIPRYLLKWTDGGGGYTDTCQQCDNDKQIALLEKQSIAKDEEIARLSAALFDCM